MNLCKECSKSVAIPCRDSNDRAGCMNYREPVCDCDGTGVRADGTACGCSMSPEMIINLNHSRTDIAMNKRVYTGYFTGHGEPHRQAFEQNYTLPRGCRTEWTAQNRNGTFCFKDDVGESLKQFGARCAQVLGRRFVLHKVDMETSRTRIEKAYHVDLDDIHGTIVGNPPGAFISGAFGLTEQSLQKYFAGKVNYDEMTAKDSTGKTIKRKRGETLVEFGKRCADQLSKRFTITHETGPSQEESNAKRYAIDRDDPAGSGLSMPPVDLLAAILGISRSQAKGLTIRPTKKTLQEWADL